MEERNDLIVTNDVEVDNYETESTESTGKGGLLKFILGVAGVGAAVGGFLYCTRDKRKQKKLKKAKADLEKEGFKVVEPVVDEVIDAEFIDANVE